jgi:hypothetical protein
MFYKYAAPTALVLRMTVRPIPPLVWPKTRRAWLLLLGEKAGLMEDVNQTVDLCLENGRIAVNAVLIHEHLLSPVSLLTMARAQFRRHLEKPQFAAPVIFDRRAVRD